MYRIKGTLEGLADLLYNSPGPVLKAKGKAPSKMSVEELDALAMEKLHEGPNGLFLPHGAFEKAVFEGATRAGLKDGKASLSRLLQAIMFIEGELLLHRDKPDYIHTVWGRVPPRTGAMVPIRRPAILAGWKIGFSLMISLDRIPDTEIRQAIDAAGLFVGFGSWRPKFGRFKVIDWAASSV